VTNSINTLLIFKYINSLIIELKIFTLVELSILFHPDEFVDSTEFLVIKNAFTKCIINQYSSGRFIYFNNLFLVKIEYI